MYENPTYHARSYLWFDESGARNAPCCDINSKLMISIALLQQSVIPDLHTVAPASQLKGWY